MIKDWLDYALDATQRGILFWDTLRQRGNAFLEHTQAGKPALLKFATETILDAREFEAPANYALLRILPEDGVAEEPGRRPFVIVDPRAGHGPGIGGFKPDSEVGFALRHGHPVYFVTFFPEPMPGQTLLTVAEAEARFLEEIRARHRQAPAPAVIGNCQAGWAIMGLAALRPELPGPLLLAGSPLSYWGGQRGLNPMRYAGGNLGGSWMAHLASDLGNGRFDGAALVENFEALSPGETKFGKYYNLLDKADTEAARFLEFERWWGGYFLMNKQEIVPIVEELFVGNKLARGEIVGRDGTTRLDLRKVQAPIVVLCSWGDNITPPQQALGWVREIYASEAEITAQGQTIIYCVHPTVGHLGIFVSAKVAEKEHAEFIGLVDLIELLPPGLYEMVVSDRHAELPGDAFVEGRYASRFERRSLEQLDALIGPRESEAAFETVRRVSEINAGLYDQFVSPVVRAMASEPMAAAMRALHPLRAQRWAFSDRNPWMQPFAALAPLVRENRRACAPDNPFRLLERRAAAAVEAAMDRAGAARDRLSEAQFEAVYTAPALRAAVGLAGAVPPPPPGADPLRVALAAHEAERLRARAAQGTPAEGIVRLLLLLLDDSGVVDERSWRALRALNTELPPERQMSHEAFRRTVREQALLIHTDRDCALAGLEALLPTPEDLAVARRVVLQAADAVGVDLRRPEQQARFPTLAAAAPESGPPRPAHPKP
ncbi:DUF3141 domain-containing protein [Dankookia sp. GCM10030260]|uniref:DUF3141 domain-containing protein n=1 Tax=Dankookia sp. GCM10030260 TaxID=3273390 RepID=UPI00361E3139